MIVLIGYEPTGAMPTLVVGMLELENAPHAHGKRGHGTVLFVTCK